jgi:hypothetical protein
MFHDDHPPPHFHAKYGEYHAKIHLGTGEIIAGKLPRRAISLVEEWRVLHRAELASCWTQVVEYQREPNKIEPLE